MKSPENLSKTYKEKAISLMERFMKIKNIDTYQQINEADLVDWLISETRPKLLPDSWRVYRNAVSLVMENKNEIVRLKSTKALNTKKNQSALYKPKSKRDKGISKDDLDKIEHWLLTKSRSQYAKPLLVWLRATIQTGLRPHEWLSARIEQSTVVKGGVALVCKNDKSTKDQHGFMSTKGHSSSKTHQAERTIDLSHLDGKEALNHIYTQIELVVQINKVIESGIENDFFDAFYKNLVTTMNNCTRGCLGERGKYPTIYSARHQFASNVKANLKEQGIPIEKARRMLAVLMGQGSPKTSTYNYGLTSKGDLSSDIPHPTATEYGIATGATTIEQELES